MSAQKEELIQAVQENYLEALRNEPKDLAAATTIEQVGAIQANVARAKEAYFAVLAKDLIAGASGVQSAYDDLLQALETEKDCRKQVSAISDILGSLKSATDAVQKVLPFFA